MRHVDAARHRRRCRSSAPPGATSCNGSTLVTCPDGTAQVIDDLRARLQHQRRRALRAHVPARAGHAHRLRHHRADARSDLTAGGGISTDNGLIGAIATPIRHANTDRHHLRGARRHRLPRRRHPRAGDQARHLHLQVAHAGARGSRSTPTAPTASRSSRRATRPSTGIVDVTCAGNVFLAGCGATDAKPYLSGPGGGDGGQPGPNDDGVAIGNNGGGSGADNVAPAAAAAAALRRRRWRRRRRRRPTTAAPAARPTATPC